MFHRICNSQYTLSVSLITFILSLNKNNEKNEKMDAGRDVISGDGIRGDNDNIFDILFCLFL